MKTFWQGFFKGYCIFPGIGLCILDAIAYSHGAKFAFDWSPGWYLGFSIFFGFCALVFAIKEG